MTTFQIQIPTDSKRSEECIEVEWAEEHPMLHNIIEGFKLVFSSCIVIVLLVVIFVGIVNRWCVLSLPPIGLFILMFLALTLLAYVEALHYACKCCNIKFIAMHISVRTPLTIFPFVIVM